MTVTPKSGCLNIDAARAGLEVRLDGGFTCHKAGHVILSEDQKGLYFTCDEGHHYIDGQTNRVDGKFVGIYPVD